MKEINGKDPVNARIKISYTNEKKPKVRFSYPDKKHQQRGSAFVYIFILWVGLNLPFAFLSTYLLNDSVKLKYDRGNYTNFVEAYTSPRYVKYQYESRENFLSVLLRSKSLFILVYVFFPPFFIYFPFKKRWNKLYPDFQAFFSFKKYRKFLSRDIKEINGEIYLELPIFSNVLCDFNATKDFSKFLSEFEIQEHQFKYLNHRHRKKIGKKKVKERDKNEYLWYARWYFKQKPKKGFLEVIFK